jgi:hypothetical protein
MSHTVQFQWRAFDTAVYPFPPGPISFFTDGASYSSDRVTSKAEAEIINWVLRTPPARELLLANLKVPEAAYVQASVREPILDRRPARKPGDLDLLLLSDPNDPSRAISIQAKRIKVEAVTTYRDDVCNRQLGNLSDLIEQANGSRELGFHLNYAMVIVQCDGIRRSEFNFLGRTTTSGQFRRIYHRTWNSPVHSDVGVIFVEISQPTAASIDRAGVVAICVDKEAKCIDQPSSLTARMRQLTNQMRSL